MQLRHLLKVFTQNMKAGKGDLELSALPVEVLMGDFGSRLWKMLEYEAQA